MSRPVIPGLPEKERVKALRKKKNKGNDDISPNVSYLDKNFFFKNVSVKAANKKEQQGEFQFSDYDASEIDEEDDDDNFADSKEVLSDDDITTVNVAPKTTSTPAVGPTKRPLNSPENEVKQKKTKGNKLRQKK